MTQHRWPALASLTGVAFVALVVLAFAIGGSSPDIKDSPQKILTFYNKHDSKQMFVSVLLAWGTVFFFFFLGMLRSALRAAEQGVARLSTVTFGGGIVLGVGMLAFAAINFTLADAADHLTPDAAQALNALNVDFFIPLSAGLATFMIATGIGSIRSRVLPAWLSWITLVVGIAAVTPVGFFAFMAFGIWTLIVSVLLWRSSARTPVPQP